MVSKKYTAASSRSEPHELKVWAVISHADMAIERNVNPLTALNRATAVGFDLPMRSDGPSITSYRAEGHLVAPRPHPSSLESSKTDTKTNTNDSFLAYMPLSPPVLQESPERAGMPPPWATSGNPPKTSSADWRPTASKNEASPESGVLVGAAFTFFNTLQSHPAVVLFVYLYAKSTIPNAQHDLEGIL